MLRDHTAEYINFICTCMCHISELDWSATPIEQLNRHFDEMCKTIDVYTSVQRNMINHLLSKIIFHLKLHTKDFKKEN